MSRHHKAHGANGQHRPVYYNLFELLGLLLDCQGVADAEDLTINGGRSSLMLEEWDIPVAGELVLKEGKR